jgi:hypothetical protein
MRYAVFAIVVSLSISGLASRAMAAPMTDRQKIAVLIQSQMPVGTTVEDVVFAGNYALAVEVSPDGETAKDVLLVKRDGSWAALVGGGGAFDGDQLRSFGVPKSVARKLIEEGDATTSAWKSPPIIYRQTLEHITNGPNEIEIVVRAAAPLNHIQKILVLGGPCRSERSRKPVSMFVRTLGNGFHTGQVLIFGVNDLNPMSSIVQWKIRALTPGEITHYNKCDWTGPHVSP